MHQQAEFVNLPEMINIRETHLSSIFRYSFSVMDVNFFDNQLLPVNTPGDFHRLPAINGILRSMLINHLGVVGAMI